MFAMRPVGCAFYALALIASACQAASVPPSGLTLAARNDSSDTRTSDIDLRIHPSRDTTDALEGRDVWNPRILAPKSSTIWKAGSSVVVKWDTSNPPKSITNREGKIVLGYMQDDNNSEHLFLDKPLATGFDIMQGSQKVTVPDMPPSDNYFLVLFGDSGNRSPGKFTIN